jgi:phage terminase large subunit-like protein
LLLAGRGFGKTRAAAEAGRPIETTDFSNPVYRVAARRDRGEIDNIIAAGVGPTPLAGTEYAHIAIVAETAADARDVCVEGKAESFPFIRKTFALFMNRLNDASLGRTAPELLCLTLLSPTNSAGHSIPLPGAMS